MNTTTMEIFQSPREFRYGKYGKSVVQTWRELNGRSIRHHYRKMRKAGLSAWDARSIIVDLLVSSGDFVVRHSEEKEG